MAKFDTFDIRNVPCTLCQRGHNMMHLCDSPDYCPCLQGSYHINEEHKVPKKFPHYPDNGPPIPDGKVVIRFLHDPETATEGFSTRDSNSILRPIREVPFATGIVDENNNLPYYVLVRGWDLEGNRWTIERLNFGNILSVTRVCNSNEYGKELQAWEAANPRSDWRSWLPSAKRPPARTET